MLCVILQASVTSVRYQVIRLMRMLVQLCNTLDQVPEEVRPNGTPFLALAWTPRVKVLRAPSSDAGSLQRYLFMKLAYNDSTPPDYEPPYFAAHEDAEPPHFARKPFSM